MLPPHAQVPGSTYGDQRGQRRKVQITAAYRFALGAENTVAADYITEKFWQLFGSRCAAPGRPRSRGPLARCLLLRELPPRMCMHVHARPRWLCP